MSMKQKIKGTRHSLTIWFNGVVASLAVGIPEVLPLIPQLQTYLPDDIYKGLMTLALIGNILLRFRTDKGLDQK